MNFLIIAFFIFALGGLLSLVAAKRPFGATCFGVGGAVSGSVVGLIPALQCLLEGRAWKVDFPWSFPGGSFAIGVDPLSAFFLVIILLIGTVCALFGSAYLLHYRETKSLGPPWFFFNILLASMVLVVTARNALLFLLAWEAMAVTSYFLVTFEQEKKEVCEAGWTYLIATHLGTAFLLVLFTALASQSGSMDFARWTQPPPAAGWLFLLAILGFGSKAGFVPLHVWLPEAHPAAPSHVSALMSGVMIKTGIYGLLRVFGFLGHPDEWWGWVMVVIGLTSGLFGIISALAQSDLKRLLAYSSVENSGIITMGIGVGLIGVAQGSVPLAVLGFAGGILHILNHSLFKTLLFLGTGTVLHATGSREMSQLGGLLKYLPKTGLLFLVGAAAISGLPFFNGFISEFLIYSGSLQGAVTGGNGVAVPAICAIVGLALMGGLALACFSKAFGVVFLGEPRTGKTAQAHDESPAMWMPMAFIAGICALIGVFPGLVLSFLGPVIQQVSSLPTDIVGRELTEIAKPLTMIMSSAFLFLVLAAVFALIRVACLRGQEIGETVTWDCGYARPKASMQYTASSFAQPLKDVFNGIVLTRYRKTLPHKALFPPISHYYSRAVDIFRENFYHPIFKVTRDQLFKLRWVQSGGIHAYILYIVVALATTIVLKLL